MGTVTARAAFSHIPFWQSLIGTLRRVVQRPTPGNEAAPPKRHTFVEQVRVQVKVRVRSRVRVWARVRASNELLAGRTVDMHGQHVETVHGRPKARTVNNAHCQESCDVARLDDATTLLVPSAHTAFGDVIATLALLVDVTSCK